PRIQPDNARAFSQAGIDTYDRLLDGMLEFGLEPFATIFHWDMPVWAGDFRNRDTAYRMADYADVLTRRFGDRIPTWALLNEPNSVAFAGYILGIHAPSLASAEAGGAAIHHQNLAAGLMAQAARANLGKNNSVTTTVNLAPMRPSSQRAPSDSVVEKADDFWNKAFLDPLFGKGYPQSVMPLVFPYIQNGDDKQITFTPDAIGVN
ncbi:MAG TPA: family 1 glycosylhydrolase, partial [Burkholderiaceae bacterium]|nr:family 1 glycosylhydrolase [Burkholderiaceae bacterium]